MPRRCLLLLKPRPLGKKVPKGEEEEEEGTDFLELTLVYGISSTWSRSFAVFFFLSMHFIHFFFPFGDARPKTGQPLFFHACSSPERAGG